MSFNLATGLRASQGNLCDSLSRDRSSPDLSCRNLRMKSILKGHSHRPRKKRASMPFSRITGTEGSLDPYGAATLLPFPNVVRKKMSSFTTKHPIKYKKVPTRPTSSPQLTVAGASKGDENVEDGVEDGVEDEVEDEVDTVSEPEECMEGSVNDANGSGPSELDTNLQCFKEPTKSSPIPNHTKRKKSSLFKFPFGSPRPRKCHTRAEDYYLEEDDILGGGSDHFLEDVVPIKRRHGPGRASWKNKIQLFLAFIGYSMGLPNVWRFPYLCYDNGGGAFFIPYIIMLLICGFPLIYLELAIGQLAQAGPIIAISKFSPLFNGLGIASVIIAFVVSLYNIVIVTWSLFYVFKSFGSTLPWSTCVNRWNSRGCYSVDSTAPDYKYLRMNMSIPSTQEFFENRVLVVSNEGEKSRYIQWELAILLFIAWIIVFFGIRRGVKSIGKAFYLTATLPFIVVIILLVKSVRLPGAYNGIAYLVKPAFEKLLVPEIWILGATQSFYSLGVAFGSLIALASYNDENNNIFRDSIVMSLSSSIISIIVMVTTYGVIGNIAFINNHDIEEAITQGPGLVFVVYPQVFSTLPYTQIWAFLYFLMMICLGLDRQFAMVEVVVTSFYDVKFFDRYLPGRQALVLIICIVSYLLGLVFLARQGIYYLHLFDYFVVGISFLHVAFFEVLMIVLFFGVGRLSNLLQAFTNRKPSLYIQLCWYTSPVLIVVIMFFHVAKHTPIRYDDRYNYPPWATGLGWFLASMPIICVFVGFVMRIYPTKNMTMSQRLKASFHSIMSSEADALVHYHKATSTYKGPLLFKPCLDTDPGSKLNLDSGGVAATDSSESRLSAADQRKYYYQRFHDPHKDRHYLYHHAHYHHHGSGGKKKRSEIAQYAETPCDPDEFVLSFMPEIRDMLELERAANNKKSREESLETLEERAEIGGDTAQTSPQNRGIHPSTSIKGKVQSKLSPDYIQTWGNQGSNFVTKDSLSKHPLHRSSNFYSVSNGLVALGLDRMRLPDQQPLYPNPLYQTLLTPDNVHTLNSGTQKK